MKIKLTFWKIVAAIIFVLGLYATIIRFAVGLGAATNLTDAFPWGIWIGFDVLVGVGLAAGGFVIAATVHIFNLGKYKPIARPAILTAFLGYFLVVIAILFDLGLPYRIWHPLIMWNPHSVMFEVGWCVTLYTIVLALEFSPMVFERFNMKVPLKFIRMIYLPIVIVGVLLSTLHQSSLGTLYVIVPDKLYGLWYSPFLPVFFFIMAIAAGLAMTIIESFLSYRAFGKRLEKDLLEGIGRVIVVVLAIYLVFKIQDLNRRGNLELAFQFNRESVLFWGEIGLGVILPMILLFMERIRVKETWLFFSALMVVIGFVVGRLNVSITGMLHSETYFPKWTELIITVALMALGFVIFTLAVKHLNVFPKEEKESTGLVFVPHDQKPVFTGSLVMAIWGFLLIGMIAFGLTKQYSHAEASTDLSDGITRLADPTDAEITLPDDIEYTGDADPDSWPGNVVFSHESHVYVQDSVSCANCHLQNFKIIGENSNREVMMMEAMYEGQYCGSCHDGDIAFSSEECDMCHIPD